MPGPTVPAQCPVLPDKSWWNDNPDLSWLQRSLAQAQNFIYCNHLLRTPMDARAWRNAHDFDAPMRNWVNNSSSGSVDRKQTNLARALAPPPLNAIARNIVFHVYATLQGPSDVATVSFTNESTGVVTKITLNNSAGSLNGNAGWYNGTTGVPVPAAGGDVINISMNYVAGGTEKTTVLSICGCWEPLDGIRSDITVQTDAGWAATDMVSQTYHGAGFSRADHTHYLRWLIRKTNQFIAHHPRPVMTSWFQVTGSPGWVWTSSITADGVVGRYRVYVGDRVPSLTLQIYGKVIGTATNLGFKVYINGVLQSTMTTFTGAFSWVSVAALTGFTKGAVNEIRIDGYINVPTGSCTVSAATISCWENPPVAADLLLPTGDAVPAAFAPVRDDLVRARTTIYADLNDNALRVGRRPLVANLVYLWATRVRHLIHDCRANGNFTTGGSDLTGTNIYLRYRYQTTSDSGNFARMLACAAAQDFNTLGQSPVVPPAINMDPGNGDFATLGQPLRSNEWIVDSKRPFSGPGGDFYKSADKNVPAASVFQLEVSGVPNPTTLPGPSGFPFGTAVEEVPITPSQLAAL